MSATLAVLCGLALIAALREAWAERGLEVRRRTGRAGARLLDRLPEALRDARPTATTRRTLARAGLSHVDPRLVLGARLAGGLAAVPLALSLAPAAPGRTGVLVLGLVPVAGSFAPALVLERAARKRAARIQAALPDALEVMAVQAGAGGGHRHLLAAGADAGRGALSDELRLAAADVECGVPGRASMRALGERTEGDVAALIQAMERSRRLGSPLATALQDQALGLRERRAREVEEGAARAAPKIQLVVALLLVPSVLLLVAAAVLANADALLVGF